jgi:hypothetical protein
LGRGDRAVALAAAVRPSGAIENDAEQDDDHAHKADQVRRDLRGRVPVHVVGMTAGSQMGRDIGEPTNGEDQQPDPDEQRKAEYLATGTF